MKLSRGAALLLVPGLGVFLVLLVLMTSMMRTNFDLTIAAAGSPPDRPIG